MSVYPFENDDVNLTYQNYSEAKRIKLLELRALVFTVATQQNIIVEESLKWGQPSYKAKQGTAIRLGIFDKDTTKIALYVNCQTTLIESYRTLFSNVLTFSGNRAVVFDVEDELPLDILSTVIELALNYFVKK